jgi:hypothetical protein
LLSVIDWQAKKILRPFDWPPNFAVKVPFFFFFFETDPLRLYSSAKWEGQ